MRETSKKLSAILKFDQKKKKWKKKNYTFLFLIMEYTVHFNLS